MPNYFANNLIKWSQLGKRAYPWIGEKDPYYIWLSEVILQQTRVDQGLSYYLKFKSEFPTVHHLADASEDQVLKLWQGLGYYSRARNLHASAKYISKELKGEFPKTYEEILALKGVGTYTAAAIASFAYNLPYAVVDGNVTRVLSRFYGISNPVDLTETKKQIAKLAQDLLDKERPALYNQAIMDLGATVCKPASPACPECIFQDKCMAHQEGTVNTIPVKSRKVKKTIRYFHYVVFESDTHTLLHKRTERDIWQHLYQFPLIESNHMFKLSDLQNSKAWKTLTDGIEFEVLDISQPLKHILTHQTIYAIFFHISVDKQFFRNKNDYLCVKFEKLNTFAFPRLIDSYLQNRTFN